MKICTKCRGQNQDDQQKCVYCGEVFADIENQEIKYSEDYVDYGVVGEPDRAKQEKRKLLIIAAALIIMGIFSIMAGLSSSKDIDEIEDDRRFNAIEVDADRVDEADEGKLIFVTGTLKWQPVDTSYIDADIKTPYYNLSVGKKTKVESKEPGQEFDIEYKTCDPDVVFIDKDGEEFKQYTNIGEFYLGAYQVDELFVLDLLRKENLLQKASNIEIGATVKRKDGKDGSYKAEIKYADMKDVDQVSFIGCQVNGKIKNFDADGNELKDAYCGLGKIPLSAVKEESKNQSTGAMVGAFIFSLLFIAGGVLCAVKGIKAGKKPNA